MSDTAFDSPLTVLVADDNPSNLALARDVLEGAGCRVRVATNGVSALGSLNAEMADVVLLDVHMPKMDGYEACRRIKADPRLSSIPVLFLSGMNEVFNKLQAFHSGAVDYVVKPFSPEELVARVIAQGELGRSKRLVQEHSARLQAALAELGAVHRRLAETERYAAFSAMSAELAHELNNPLNYVTLCAESLRDDVLECLSLSQGPGDSSKCRDRLDFLKDEIARLTEGLMAGADRSARIVKTLKSIESETKVSWRVSNISSLAELALSLAVGNDSRTIRLINDIVPDVQMSCVPEKLTELFYSLVTNAVAASAQTADPWIRVFLTKEDHATLGPCLLFGVQDSGRGIPEEDRPLIFDPFYSREEREWGFGLRLSTALRIAKEHGGIIELEETSSKGSLFTTRLPTDGVSRSR